MSADKEAARETVKRILSVFCLAVLLTAVLSAGGCGIIKKQYNSNGVSNILVIAIDETHPKEYVGALGSQAVYVEKLDPDSLYFVTKEAERIPLKDAVEKGLTSVDDWRNGAWKTNKEGNTEILRYENYEIAVTGDECVIRPLTR